jgi:prepilin-type N-terminal cleavage/methylation domain-containing protein
MCKSVIEYTEVFIKYKKMKYQLPHVYGNNKAFTLTELIIVIAILAVFATVSFFSYSPSLKDASNTKQQVDADTLETIIEMNTLQNDSFPSRTQ